MQRTPYYIHPTIDRAAGRRTDPAWVTAQFARPEARLLPIWRGRNLITGPREAPQPVFAAPSDDWCRERMPEPILLGLIDGTPYFAADFSAVDGLRGDLGEAGIGSFTDLRICGPLLTPRDGALLAHARAASWFHLRHRFCGACGHPTEARHGGQLRACTNPDCKAEYFPRLDPAVIVLVHDGERCLMARQKHFPPGLHALLAGFLEPMEGLEDCVAREVFEETRLTLTEIDYFASQPWPFPQSLMLGFVARAAGTDLRIDPEELEHAAWYEPDFLRAHADTAVGGKDFVLPRRDSIARQMLDAWLAGML